MNTKQHFGTIIQAIITGALFAAILVGAWLLEPQTQWVQDPVTGMPTEIQITETN